MTTDDIYFTAMVVIFFLGFYIGRLWQLGETERARRECAELEDLLDASQSGMPVARDIREGNL